MSRALSCSRARGQALAESLSEKTTTRSGNPVSSFGSRKIVKRCPFGADRGRLRTKVRTRSASGPGLGPRV